MTDPIKPALTPEEWNSVQRGNGIDNTMGYLRSSVLDELNFLEGGDIQAAIAYLNHALPDDDPRKITRAMVSELRSIACELSTSRAATLRHIARMLDSYLPPITLDSKE